MIYPFNQDIAKIMTFRDKHNNVVCLVAKQEDFNNIDELSKYLVDHKINKTTIRDDYIRFYNSLPKNCDKAYITHSNEGYALCKQGRGAKKVFVIERG